MQPARHALVAGGTGLIGNELLALLGNDTRYHGVTSLVRRDAPAVAGVTNRIISF
jgi:NAD dependent epimerase/dehydratase family enzyme